MLFEITKDHIAQLTDTDLRIIIGLLCEAELRRRNSPTLLVTYGGHQDAKDGGLDARVSLDPKAQIGGAVPRSSTGFQSKAEPMAPADIAKEMRPKDQLRRIFRELASAHGAYIIASSKSSVTDIARTKRIRAMKEAVSELPNHGNLHLDFYDGNRLATWVRDHPGMVLWVREKTGQPLKNWRPYEQWTTATGDDPFLTDDGLRFRTPNASSGSPVSIVEGFAEVRQALFGPRTVVRFVGLSGVGKTRIAQALFEDSVLGSPLDRSLAIYTNLGPSTEPTPLDLATQLIATGQRAILVIDNCPSDTHAELAELCRKPTSQLSLLTIEYDIRDDQPEGTEVYEIEFASDALIQKLIEGRFPKLTKLDAERAAEFAGGNARVAIAIAGTVKENGSIAELNDDTLFRRLFDQRNDPNENLLQSAQVCSLLYSFNVEDEAVGDAAELRQLGRIIGGDFDVLYRHAEILRRRDLIQARGEWRAVLPHALANRMARFAFGEIPLSRIEAFTKAATPRALQSFSRRMSYLHESVPVQKIVDGWLKPEGLLGQTRTLTKPRIEMFKNVAPVNPDAALAALERSLKDVSDAEVAERCAPFQELLWSLAYDAALFERATEILIRISIAETERPGRSKSIGISGLFGIFLSGTHASIQQRMQLAESLLTHVDPRRRDIGKAALDTLLQTNSFISFHSFSFGGRRRDYGYLPATKEDILAWYRAVLDFCLKVDAKGGSASDIVRSVLAERLTGLWRSVELPDELASTSLELSSRRYWPEGWLAVCSIRRWGKNGCNAEELEKMAALEVALRPTNLTDRVEAFLKRNGGSGYWDWLDDDEEEIDDRDYSIRMARAETVAHELGKEIVQDAVLLPKAAKSLVSTSLQGASRALMRGILEAHAHPDEVWRIFTKAFQETPKALRQGQILASLLFVMNAITPLSMDPKLDEALTDPVLGDFFPELQASIGFDKRGIERIKKSLQLGLAPKTRYLSISYTLKPMPGRALRVIVRILMKSDGFDVALQLVWMAVASAKHNKKEVDAGTILAGKDLLLGMTWKRSGNMNDYHFAEVAETVPAGPDGEQLTRKVCNSFLVASAKYATGMYEHGRLFSCLASLHPNAVMDTLVLTETKDGLRRIRSRFREASANIFGKIPERTIRAWCDKDPTVRYPLMAAAIYAFTGSEDEGKRHWTPTALMLLQHAPSPIGVLKTYTDQFYPYSFSGSQAAAMEANIKLLDEIEEISTLTNFVREERSRLMAEVEKMRQSELRFSRTHDLRFE